MSNTLIRASVVSVLLTIIPLCGQPQAPLVVNRTGVRSFAEAIRQLREKTGWLVSLEEPVWPSKGRASNRTLIDSQGRQVEPPDEERIQIDLPTLSGATARHDSMARLLSAYNAQNTSRAFKIENIGSRIIIVPERPAVALLSTPISIPVATRAPSEHVTELLKAVTAQSGIPTSLDTAAFGFQFDLGYSGKEHGISQWGATSKPAREALADFLDGSVTSTVWQLDCQVGITPTPGHCILSLMPITIEVKDRGGKLTKRTLIFDRGGAEIPLPPPPPQ